MRRVSAQPKEWREYNVEKDKTDEGAKASIKRERDEKQVQSEPHSCRTKPWKIQSLYKKDIGIKATEKATVF